MFTEADAKRVGGWTMPFGKYKGMKFRDIDDEDYIEWIVEKTDFFKDDKYPSNKFIREYLKLYLDDDDRIFLSKEEKKEECALSDSSDDEGSLSMDCEDTKIVGRYFECNGKKYLKEMDQEGKLWVQFTEDECDFFGFELISFAKFIKND